MRVPRLGSDADTSTRANTQEEVAVTVTDQYTDGGMLTFTDDDFKKTLQDETGVKPEWAAEAFPDPSEDVRQSLRRIEASPVVTKHVSARGFVFDVTTGTLKEVVL